MNNRNYPAWQAVRSNEDFDRAQQLATQLTEADRAAGRPVPNWYGYSKANFDRAAEIVKRAALNFYRPGKPGVIY